MTDRSLVSPAKRRQYDNAYAKRNQLHGIDITKHIGRCWYCKGFVLYGSGWILLAEEGESKLKHGVGQCSRRDRM